MDFSTFFIRLGLNPDDFEYAGNDIIETDDGFVYHATLKAGDRSCPRCKRGRVVRIGYYTKHVKCSMNRNFRETLILRVPRLKCANPKCGQVTFSPSVDGIRGVSTVPTQTVKLISLDLRREMSATQIARDYDVSKSFVLKILDDVYGDVARMEFGEEICVDEFKFHNSPQGKYPMIIVDGSTGRLLDVVRSRRKDTMHAYFRRIPREERLRVRFFNSDMYDPYRDARRIFFPNATHVIDPFHIVKQFTAALNMERNRAFKHADQESVEARFQKQHWKLFLCRRRDIPDKTFYFFDYDGERQPWKSYADAVDAILGMNPMLLSLHDALLAMFSLIDGQNRRPSREELDWITRKLDGSGSEEGRKVAATMRKWAPEITTTFALKGSGQYHSNSPAEGMNNRIATLIKISYGMVDFTRLRNRALLIYGLGADSRLDDERAAMRKK